MRQMTRYKVIFYPSGSLKDVIVGYEIAENTISISPKECFVVIETTSIDRALAISQRKIAKERERIRNGR